MEINMSFISGLACGLCLGVSLFAIRRINMSPKNVKEVVKKTKEAFFDGKDYKVVFVVRNDLKMGKGKIAAQCGHAAVGVYSKALKKSPDVLKSWEYFGQTKIALKVESEEELEEIYENAKNAGLIVSKIRDAGRTQIAPSTQTVLGIGPALTSEVDAVTGHLKLL